MGWIPQTTAGIFFHSAHSPHPAGCVWPQLWGLMSQWGSGWELAAQGGRVGAEAQVDVVRAAGCHIWGERLGAHGRC